MYLYYNNNNNNVLSWLTRYDRWTRSMRAIVQYGRIVVGRVSLYYYYGGEYFIFFTRNFQTRSRRRRRFFFYFFHPSTFPPDKLFTQNEQLHAYTHART